MNGMSTESLNGVLLVDKAAGMTSHDVVAIARRSLQTKKIGHCGTLDPLATGLLIIVIGRGTKMQDLLMSEDKEYVGTMKLGEVTDSQDADGEILESHPVPDFSRSEIENAFSKFRGDFYQLPPMVSAIKKDGVALYKLARQGKTVEREPRFVHVFADEILEAINYNLPAVRVIGQDSIINIDGRLNTRLKRNRPIWPEHNSTHIQQDLRNLNCNLLIHFLSLKIIAGARGP